MSLPPKGSNQLRKGRFSQVGTIYFITKTANHRLPKHEPPEKGVFMYEGVPEIIIGSLEWLDSQNKIDLIAYVIMPDHIHVLFVLNEGQDLAKVMMRFAGFTGKQISAKLHLAGGVWQSGYYDRALREDELEIAYKYIYENPLKAGYGENVSDWKWLYPYPE
jgi:putative transposase